MTTKSEAKRTPVTVGELVAALRAAWPVVFPAATPTAEAIAMFAAQVAHETGCGRAMYNSNVGNVKGSENAEHMFLRTWERLLPAAAAAAVAASTPTARCEYREGGRVDAGGMVAINVFPDHPTGRFRAYPSLAAGCTDYLRLFTGRYKDCLACAATGDAAGFVGVLHKRGYFTGPEADYLSGVQHYYAQALPLARGGDSIA
jgi:hypothetical protein